MRLDEIKLIEEYEPFLTNKDDILEAFKRLGLVGYHRPDRATIHEDGTVDIHKAATRITNRKMKRLPFRIGKVEGEFEVSRCALVSLEGMPREVELDFIVSDNKLRSLVGGPEKVGGSYMCKNNALTDLKGAPEYIGRDFNASDNSLDTMEGGPTVIEQDYDLSNNHITNFDHSPEKVGRVFNLQDNNITSLEGIADKISSIGENSGGEGGVLKIGSDMGSDHAKKIKKGGLGLLMIPHLRHVHMVAAEDGAEKYKTTILGDNAFEHTVEGIIDKYLRMPDKQHKIFDCQNELIEHGYEDYAEL